MQLKPFLIRQLLLKLAVFATMAYVIIVSISILITSFLFISLNSYKTRIGGVIFKHTGYALNIGDIKTKLNSFYLPEITIDNIEVNNPSNSAQHFAIKEINFTFSYASIWNLEPIFKNISIDGMGLKLDYLKDGSIILNGINLNHPDKKTIENTKNSPIDIENWILKQDKIQLSNIDFSFNDEKNNLSPIELHNVTMSLTSKLWHRHKFSMIIGSKKQPYVVGAELNWKGGKITEFDKWSRATFRLLTYNNPAAGLMNSYWHLNIFQHKFSADTALTAKLSEGKLDFLYANFDVKNFQYALKESSNFISFPELGGTVNINLTNNNEYKFIAHNLTIAAPDGYVLNNKVIHGNYQIDKKGSLDITNTDISGFNHLFSMLSIHNLSLSGNIETINLGFIGNIFKPQSYYINSKFSNLSLKSTNPNIPSLDNLNGNVQLTESGGTINLLMESSTLNYKNIFVMPYKFSHVDSKINWLYNQDKTITVTLNPTTITTPDFSGVASGSYKYIPGTLGYIDLTAKVNRVPINKIEGYLPAIIGKEVHEWLHMGLASGYGVDGKLELQGNLADFPYASGNGKFYINANLEKGKLKYLDGWPTINNINGTFEIRNAEILVLAKSANVMGNKLANVKVDIPNMIATHAYLTADGTGSGTTAKFLAYLANTPINDVIGKIPEKVTTTGTGNLNLHLNLPFTDLEKFDVSGDYQFNNNNLQFHDLPIPLISDTNGKLHFTQHGVQIDKISANILHSDAILSANTASDGTMNFKIISPNLDYKQTTLFYLPTFANLVNGNANTTINFIIDKTGLSKITANSDLNGVTVLAARPLKKESATSSLLNLNLINKQNNFNIVFNYANQLFGNIFLTENGNINNGQINLGKNSNANLNNSWGKFIVNVDLKDTYALEWLDTIKQTLKSAHAESSATITNNTLASSAPSNISASTGILPIEVFLNTAHLYVGNTNFNKTSADIVVNDKQTIFNLNNSQANGYGSYTYATNNLNVSLNDFNIFSSIDESNSNKPTLNEQNPNRSSNPALMIAELNNLQTSSNLMQNFGNAKFSLSESDIENTEKIINSKESGIGDLDFPKIDLAIKNLYYENRILGTFSVKMRPQGKNLLIESGVLTDEQDKTVQIKFSGANYCMECGFKKSFVSLSILTTIYNLGDLLENLSYGKIVAKGSGTVNASIQWNGNLQDFDANKVIATVDAKLKAGKFLKVDTGNLIGRLIGLINLQTLVNFVKLDFADVFENGFYFNNLDLQAYILNDMVDVKKIYMSSDQAVVQSRGSIDIDNNKLNLYLSVTPSLGFGVALGAVAATGFNPIIGPIVGISVYAAERILGNPFNKLFTFAFHITGSLQKPEVQTIEASKQILDNVSSAIGK